MKLVSDELFQFYQMFLEYIVCSIMIIISGKKGWFTYRNECDNFFKYFLKIIVDIFWL